MGLGDWSWKQAVAEKTLEIVNLGGSLEFRLEDVYEYTPVFKKLFPKNRHIPAKIRQILQRLRDEGFLEFEGGGFYRLNSDFEDLAEEAPFLVGLGAENPRTKKGARNWRLRNTFLAREIKKRYSFKCQVCRSGVSLGKKTYAEGHHLKPLGFPHFGPDLAGNIIVLCPNHHVMFDYGAATIVPRSFEIRHVETGIFAEKHVLHVEPWHILRNTCVSYHYTQIYAGK